MDSIAANPQAIKRRNPQGASEIPIRTATVLALTEFQADSTGDTAGNLIEVLGRFIELKQRPDGAGLDLKTDFWIR